MYWKLVVQQICFVFVFLVWRQFSRLRQILVCDLNLANLLPNLGILCLKNFTQAKEEKARVAETVNKTSNLSLLLDLQSNAHAFLLTPALSRICLLECSLERIRIQTFTLVRPLTRVSRINSINSYSLCAL